MASGLHSPANQASIAYRAATSMCLVLLFVKRSLIRVDSVNISSLSALSHGHIHFKNLSEWYPFRFNSSIIMGRNRFLP